MTTKERIKQTLNLLDTHYPYENKCYLNYTQPYELLFATMLSAQCTDDRVNIATKSLFQNYPNLQAYANANLTDIEKKIFTTGFYKNKAKNIIATAKILLEDYQGILPSSIEELTKLPGVGRKTANVVRCHIFNIPSIVVDTHVKRISNRLKFTKETDPTKIEFDLMKKLPKSHWIRYNHQIIALGRAICKAPTPKCSICFLNMLCPANTSLPKGLKPLPLVP